MIEDVPGRLLVLRSRAALVSSCGTPVSFEYIIAGPNRQQIDLGSHHL